MGQTIFEKEEGKEGEKFLPSIGGSRSLNHLILDEDLVFLLCLISLEKPHQHAHKLTQPNEQLIVVVLLTLLFAEKLSYLSHLLPNGPSLNEYIF